MKNITLIIGARPNFMKAFPVYEALKEDFNLTLIHTGQHFDAKMSDVFFNQLKFPRPDIHLSLEKKTKSGHFDDKMYVNNGDYLKDKDAVIQELMTYDGDLGQLGEIRDKLKVEFEKCNPDLVVVFGDVTSTLAAGLAAKILNIDLAHVESGLRSGDMLMPEEVNRMLTDHITKYYFITEQSGVDNLKEIGVTENVYLVGNTMIDTQKKYLQQALDTKYHETLGVKSKEYVLITLHRPSNVDDMDKLKEIFDDFEELSKSEKLVYPIHPRTKNNLEKLGYLKKVEENPNIILDEPLGYLEFTCLMANCKYLVTDSGGLQEESTALDIPCFTLRENTERPSTLIENNGTNQMIHKISEIELKECNGSMDLWDGKSNIFIKKILNNILNNKRKICLFTCNRAEYCKLEPIIKYLNNSNNYELYLIVTGSHLIYDHGNTVDLIEYPIYSKINTLIYGGNTKIMPESCGLSMIKIPQLLSEINPDGVIIHGDRFDVLSIASTCALMNICIIHFEGGELTGTIDEHLRHAITKLSTYHFVSNINAYKVVEQLGENTNAIFNIGCPSYNSIINLKTNTKYLNNINGSEFNVNEKDYILSIYHPITTNLKKTLIEYEIYIQTLIETNKKVIFFYPNVDYGSKEMIRILNLKKIYNNNNFLLVKSLDNTEYLNLLYFSAVIVGNSSSGIREACIFGIPSITIGSRQSNRTRDLNTITIDKLNKKKHFISKINQIYGHRYNSNPIYGNNSTLQLFNNILNSLDLEYKEKTLVIKD
jgi:UDP-N-acetylglucosamine 2-epimerase (non-hydrolysing)